MLQAYFTLKILLRIIIDLTWTHYISHKEMLFQLGNQAYNLVFYPECKEKTLHVQIKWNVCVFQRG